MNARRLSIGTLIKAATERGFDPARYLGVEDPDEVDLADTHPGHKSAPERRDLDAHRLSNNLSSHYRLRQLAGGYMLPAEITLVAGAGGHGKTMFVLLLLLQLATGKPLLNSMTQKPETVAFVSLEESRAEVARKLRAIVKWFGLDKADLGGLLIYGNDDAAIRSLTMTGPRGQPAVSQEGLNSIAALLAESGASAIGIDCLAPLVPSGANDNGLVYDANMQLKLVLQRYDCALVMVAHTRKGAQDDTGADAVAGAAAWVNSARVVVWIKPASTQECQAWDVPLGHDRDIKAVEVAKANHRVRGAVDAMQMISVVLQPGLGLQLEDSVGVLVPFTPSGPGRQFPPALLREALDIIAAGAVAGPFSTALQNKKQGGRYLVPVLAEAATRQVPSLKGNEAATAAKGVIAHLQAQGWIEEFAHKSNGHHRQGLAVKWAATPWAGEPAPQGPFVQ